MRVLSVACISLHHVCAWCLWLQKTLIASFGVVDGYEPSYGCWESNLDPQEE